MNIHTRYQDDASSSHHNVSGTGVALAGAGPEVGSNDSTWQAWLTSSSGNVRPEGGPLKLATATTGQSILPALDRACIAAHTASDNKARDVLVLDMRQITPLYDYFVLATGNSRRQVHSITEGIDAALVAQGDRRRSIEGYEASTWVMQDYGDVVIHVFNPQTREYYGLEELWADAPRVDWENHELPEAES